MGNLREHAKRELRMIGEDPSTIEGYLRVIDAFSSMGHSGGSAAVAIPTIHRLLNFKPLRPLTNNPDEWMQVSPDLGFPETTWQNRRDSEAFSTDGGKTYRLNSEYREGIPGPSYISEEA